MSTPVSADDDTVVDQINITIPVSCTLSGNGMNTHNADIANGQYNSAIGETTMKAFCNDNEGFAIYAIGYTDDTDGKNVLTSSTLGSNYDIATGTATSGNTSNWAMKLSTITSPTPTYPLIIQNSFDSFHAVPDDYTLVAKRTAATDIGTNAEGSTLKSTYQAYINATQPAGTYSGQVKYVLVHPNNVDAEALKDAITVVFDGNGLTFPNGNTTNTVKYANVCAPGEYGYVSNTYQEVMTSNITTGGTQSGAYTDHESILQTITLPGADKVKVVVEYGITGDTMGITIAEGTWGGWNDGEPIGDYLNIYPENNNLQGQRSFVFDGNAITFFSESWDTPESGYDKGFYAKVYPVYNTEQPGTTGEELPSSDCSVLPISGTYAETSPWKGKWLDESSDPITNEGELASYLEYNYDSIKGTTIGLSAYNPYTLTYDGNGASNEFGMGTQTTFDRDAGYIPMELYDNSVVTLLAPNYKRTGYGFIGWSTDSSAASHLATATLYGPNETITVDQTLLAAADNTGDVKLYATWLPSSGNLQNWSGCSSMSVGSITALTDTRDNDTYAVAKLADGNCWMIENLRLGGTSPMELTAANTQSAGTLPAATSTWGTGDTDQNLDVENTVNPPYEVAYDRNVRNYAYGNYYSYATAINSTANIPYDTDATTSICPAGWALPSRSIYGGLGATLRDNDSGLVTSSNFRSYPNNFLIASGGINANGVFSNYFTGGGSYVYADYWTSHSGSQSYYRLSYVLSIYIGDANIDTLTNQHSGGPSYKYRGYSVRCVLPSS